MRRYVSILTLLALMPAVYAAPFLHTHWHENNGHFIREHLAHALNAHLHSATRGCWHGRIGSVTTITSHDDDDAIPLNWFQNHPQPGPSLEFVLVETTVIPAPEPTEFCVGVPAQRSHDPPLVVSLSPRSPPTACISPLGA